MNILINQINCPYILVPEIVAAWKKLVLQFKKADEKQSSGSAAKQNDFPYYDDMQFLKPALQHTTAFSTMQVLPISAPTNNASASPATKMPGMNNHFENQSHLYLPTASAHAAPPFGQHPYWPMIPPPYLQFVQPQPGTSSTPTSYMPMMPNNYAAFPMYNPHMPLMPMDSATTSIPNPYMPLMPANSTASAVPNSYMPLMSKNSAASSLSTRSSTITNPNAMISTETGQSITTPSSSSTTKKRVPNYDHFAIKKAKVIDDNDKQLKDISSRIITSLESLNKKME